MRTFTLPRRFVTLDGRMYDLPVDDSPAASLVRAVAETAGTWARTYFRSLGSVGADRDAIREMVVRAEADVVRALDAWRVAGWDAEHADVEDLRSTRRAGHIGSVA